MTANEQSPAGGNVSVARPRRRAGFHEETIKTDRIQIERKAFVFALKENPRGRFLRITEDINGRRDSIIIPAPGLKDFKQMMEVMIQASDQTPSKFAEATPEEPG